MSGEVLSRAPSIDPHTKKVEMWVAVKDTPEQLLVGQSARVRISPNITAVNKALYLVPIQAIQINPRGAFVFTVNGESQAEAVQVEIGATQGEFAEVKKGISDGMKIVATVQDLKDGDRVEVEE